MNICMFVRNNIENDPRVKGEALVLKEAGHNIYIIGTHEEKNTDYKKWSGIDFIRVDNRRTIFRKIVISIIAILHFPLSYRRFRKIYIDKVLKSEERKMLKEAKKFKYDVCHAHDLNTLRVAYLAARECKARLIYDSHELWVEWRRDKCGDPEGVVDFWKQIEASLIFEADEVITVSDGIAEIIKKMYSLGEKPHVLYNCAQLKDYEKKNRIREMHKEIDSKKKIVLYQGAIIPGRGLQSFVQVAKIVPEAFFIIIGPESNSNFYKDLKKYEQDIENLKILSPVPYDELWEITCSADVGFVCTEPLCESYDNGLSNKIFEYMNAGLPIIASKVKGHIELYKKIPEDSNPIILIDYTDIEASAKVIKDILKDDAKISDRSSSSRRLAENYFNRDKEFSKLINIYEKLKELGK